MEPDHPRPRCERKREIAASAPGHLATWPTTWRPTPSDWQLGADSTSSTTIPSSSALSLLAALVGLLYFIIILILNKIMILIVRHSLHRYGTALLPPSPELPTRPSWDSPTSGLLLCCKNANCTCVCVLARLLRPSVVLYHTVAPSHSGGTNEAQTKTRRLVSVCGGCEGHSSARNCTK